MGWIEWKGGECPLPAFNMVVVKFRCGIEVTSFSDLLDWSHDQAIDDIVAYKEWTNDKTV